MASYYSTTGYGANSAGGRVAPPEFYSTTTSSYASTSSFNDVSGAITPGALGGPTGTIKSSGGGGGGAGTPTPSTSTGPIMVRNWYNAFTPWTGIEGQEPPLLQELGINFDHILAKSLTVLNPLRRVDPHIMDDADLAGPLVFCFVFASFLLLVSFLSHTI